MSTHRYILPDEPEPQTGARLLYVASAQYSEEWNSTLHTHSCAELFFITGGHGVFQVRQERFPVAINDLVVVSAGVPHAETSQDGSPMEYVVLGVEGLETLADRSGRLLLHLPSGGDGVGSCLHMLRQESREEKPGCDRICRSLLDIILLRLHRREDFALSPTAAAVHATRECDLVRRYIDNHFKESLTLDQLAALAHINKFYLSHTFRQAFNTSPISYLISRRIQESRFLLTETDLSLSQIAQILGFSSLSYFSQSFRRLENISPMEYRKQHRQPGHAG